MLVLGGAAEGFGRGAEAGSQAAAGCGAAGCGAAGCSALLLRRAGTDSKWLLPDLHGSGAGWRAPLEPGCAAARSPLARRSPGSAAAVVEPWEPALAESRSEPHDLRRSGAPGGAGYTALIWETRDRRRRGETGSAAPACGPHLQLGSQPTVLICGKPQRDGCQDRPPRASDSPGVPGCGLLSPAWQLGLGTGNAGL